MHKGRFSAREEKVEKAVKAKAVAAEKAAAKEIEDGKDEASKKKD